MKFGRDPKQVLRYAGYAAFFFASLIMGLYLTFPWNAARERLFDLAERQAGIIVTASSLEPSWLTGFELKDVTIKTPNSSGPPLAFDRLRARVKVLNALIGRLGIALSGNVGKGEFTSDIGFDKLIRPQNADVISFATRLNDVQLGSIAALPEMTGLPMLGTVTADVELNLDKKEAKNTNGHITLKTRDLKLEKGGKVGMIPLPPIEIGNVELNAPIAEGKASFRSIKLVGTDLEITMDGTVTVPAQLDRSIVDLRLGLKPTDKLLDFIRPLLSMASQYKNDAGFYGVSLVGGIRNVRATPQKL